MRAQLDAFNVNFAHVDMARAHSANLTPYDVVITASMIDREAQVAAERKLVAAVIWNRLRTHMLLQIDATVQYALGKTKPVLTYDDLEVDSPYNTYKHPGLPPTPISNPGLAALQAAADPAAVDYLYYVARADGTGRHYFSKSYEEFLANQERAASNGKWLRSAPRSDPSFIVSSFVRRTTRGCSRRPPPRGKSSGVAGGAHWRHAYREKSTVTGTTKVIGIIGDPVSHSMSPLLHNAAFAASGLDMVYVPLRVEAPAFRAAIQGVVALGFRGANVTVPHKGAVLPYLDWLDDDARFAEAVNTVVVDRGEVRGYNTDVDGVRGALQDAFAVTPCKELQDCSLELAVPHGLLPWRWPVWG